MLRHARRYAKQTLKLGGNAATTLDSADTVFVYDYCYTMKGLGNATAASHWWLKQRFNGTAGASSTLLQLYRWAQLPLCPDLL